MKNNPSKKDIAVVGISCKFNKASDYNEYWSNLVNGVEMLDYYESEDLIKMGVDKNLVNNPNFIKVSSFVNKPESFDYPFFGYTREEANAMDPQIRILHEQVWLALEDAGCNISKYKNRIGLYLAASENVNWIAHSMLNQNEKVAPFYQAKISNKNYISSLISYNLNLTGPSYYIDTACSSSLTAVHIACRNLLLRECTVAVAGGIKINPVKNYGYFYEEGMTASKDGRCRSFDSDSSGTVGGNGAGIVVLKRLEEAINDGDPIHAIIKSSVVNNDGKQKVGYTAPSVTGQANCIKSAHKFAGIDPKTITYVEAHGTGTKLGDPIEIDALNEAFNYDSEHKCAIGSVKTNLGHLDTAAGVAGLIKACLSLSKKVIPPSLHFKKPNPNIDFDSGPFYVNSKPEVWTRKNNLPLRAGLSSIGIGGTNVHMILEEFIEDKKSMPPKNANLILLSAKTPESLRRYSSKLKAFLNERNDINIPNLSYTLGTGRSFYNYRNYLVCDDKESILEGLDELVKHENYKLDIEREIVFMFPGQGSQYFEMAKKLYKEIDFFKKNMDLGLRVLKLKTGEVYDNIIGYTEKKENPDLINETQYTQPLLFLIEYTLAKLLMEWGVTPKYMIGHSLGEYVAACLSGVFTIEDAIEIIVKRASLMSKMEKGSMLHIATSLEDLKPLLTNDISIAAINTQDSVVVSGTTKKINEFQNLLEQEDIQCKILKTSHAFHSSMMDDMLNDFRSVLQQISFSNPKISFISNLTGKSIQNEEATSIDYWVNHLRQTVKFSEGIKKLLDKDCFLIEIGVGRTLTTFCKQNVNYSGKKHMTVNLLGHAQQNVDDLEFLMNSIGKLWAKGLNINWDKVFNHENRKKIFVPGYNFDTYKLDFDINPFKEIKNSKLVERRKITEWFYTPNWKKSFLQFETDEDVKNSFLIFSDESSLLKSVIKTLRRKGNNVKVVIQGDEFCEIEEGLFTLNPEKQQDIAKLFQTIDNAECIDKIIFGWTYSANDQFGVLNAYKKYLNLCKTLIDIEPDQNKEIFFLSNINNSVYGDEKVNFTMSVIWTLGKIVDQENPNISCRFIDVDTTIIDEDLTRELTNEIYAIDKYKNIAYRNNERWVEFYDEINVNHTKKPDLKNKLILITGGLGQIGQHLTNHLCNTYESEVILVGRSILPDEADWDKILEETNATEEKVRANVLKLKSLKDKGYKVRYYTTDVSDISDFENTVEMIEKNHGKLSGVMHTAGNNDIKSFKPIYEIDEEIISGQFDSKVAGTLNIHTIFKDRNLDFVWITSSLSSVLGGLTYGAYASANKFIDGFIQHHKRNLKNWICLNLDGVGKNMISSDELIMIFEKSLGLINHKQLIISIRDIKLAQQKQLEVKDSVNQLDIESEAIERPMLDTDFELPETDMEIELCKMFQEFFGINKIGVKDDFFELGGDSLKAMIFIKRINTRFGVEINLKEFFSLSNVKKMSLKIDLLTKINKIQSREKGKNIIKI